ncbi:MAG: hypothetical protein M5U34_02215 [Chloroflexi bacterium]|nr:hypothetical protein [Chloroflexota bacterium]
MPHTGRFHPDTAVMHLNNPLHQRQTNTRALTTASSRSNKPKPCSW